MSTTTDRTRATLRRGVDELKRLRDELRLTAHLGGMEIRDAFDRIEPRVDELERRLGQVGDEAYTALLDTFEELRVTLVKLARPKT